MWPSFIWSLKQSECSFTCCGISFREYKYGCNYPCHWRHLLSISCTNAILVSCTVCVVLQCVMDFGHPDGTTVLSVVLPRRSALVMAGEARWVSSSSFTSPCIKLWHLPLYCADGAMKHALTIELQGLFACLLFSQENFPPIDGFLPLLVWPVLVSTIYRDENFLLIGSFQFYEVWPVFIPAIYRDENFLLIGGFPVYEVWPVFIPTIYRDENFLWLAVSQFMRSDLFSSLLYTGMRISYWLVVSNFMRSDLFSSLLYTGMRISYWLVVSNFMRSDLFSSLLYSQLAISNLFTSDLLSSLNITQLYDTRYMWTHGITPRCSDIVPVEVDGGKAGEGKSMRLTLVKRDTRTSFTFRKIRDGPCTCSEIPYPL